jgi:hypothetical protein
VDTRYNSKSGNISIIFTPVEAKELSLIMEMVIEEEWEKGTSVPDLKKDFFRNLETSAENTRIDFDFEYLKFCIVFLAEVHDEMVENEIDAGELRDFLTNMYKICPFNHTIH